MVRDEETKARLAETLRGTRAGRSNPATEAVRSAPVVIVACAERGLSGYYKNETGQNVPATDKGEWWFMFDVALAMQNIALAAYALGLGTVHAGLFDSGEVARILDIPDNVAVIELMPLGWPDEEPAARPRNEINQFVSYDKYRGR